MREILFRGKRTDNGEWIYGDLRQYASGVKAIFDYETESRFFVDENTIGQYTGLTDKNGKKIFEGDILKYKSNSLCRVSYINCQFAMMWELVYRDFSDVYDKDIEVIGNIYDNPELLKECERE